MPNAFSKSTQLPAIAFTTLALTGETLAIHHGETRFYRVTTTKTADELNCMYGVSKAQARAMLAGLLLGWHTLLASQETYDTRGELRETAVIEKQQVD